MKRNNKKGFTIIELVVVIAVIAILAAVLIPTFSSIIKKANTSADIQAVNTMNKYLAIEEVTGNKTIVDVYDALKEGGMTAKDYHPLASDTYFFWDSALNRIVYTDESYNIIYPENSGAVKANGWFSLSNTIKGDSNYTSTTATESVAKSISVSSGEQLYQAVQDLPQSSEQINLKSNGEIKANFENSINESTTITLTQNVDMMGASLSFGVVMTNCNLVIDGNGYTIKNVSNLTSGIDNAELNAEGKERNYYSGIIKYVDSGATVTFKNIKFDNIIGGKDDIGSAGLLVGNSKGALTFESVEITNSTLYGKNKLGAFVGAMYAGKISIEVKGNCKLDNVNIISTEGESGILFGSTDNGGNNNTNVKISHSLFGENGEINFITNCSVVCTSTALIDIDISTTGLNKTLDGKYVEKIDENGKYRPTTAFLGFDGKGDKTYPQVSDVTDFNPISTYAEAKAAGWIYNFTENNVVS